MKINKKFNTLSLSEYRHTIENHDKYTDFNLLGLYRSILENPRLDEAGQLEVLTLANRHFQTFYDFLIVKDINTYARLSRLGQAPLTDTQAQQYREQLREQALKILAHKKIRNWRVGIYATSERYAADENSEHGYREVRIMTQKRSGKQLKTAHIPHKRARKQQEKLIRQAWQEDEDQTK